MARQCIYCGRALQPGEACKCRSGPEPKGAPKQSAGPEAKTSSDSKKATADPAAQKQKTKDAERRAQAERERFRANASRSGTTGTGTAGTKRPGGNTRSASATGNLPAKLKTLFRQYAGFLRAPIDTALAFAADPGIAGILLLVSLEAVAAAILGAVGSRSPVFYQSFMVLGFSMQGAVSTVTIALLAAIQSFVRLGLLSAVFYAYIRFVAKQRVTFQSVVAAAAPASAPMAVLMIVACLSAGNATSLAALTLVLGMLAGILLMFFTFRRLIRLSDNQTVMLLVFGNLLYFSVLSLLTGTLSLLA